MKLFFLSIAGILSLGILFKIPKNYFEELMFKNSVTASAGIPIFHNTNDENTSLPQINKSTPIFPEVHVYAKSVLVEEYPGGKIIFEKNPDARLPLASLTKLMTALAAEEIFSSRAGPFPVTVRISEEAIRQEGDSGFHIGEEFFASDLSDVMLVASSNDAAYALGERAGSFIDSSDPIGVFVQYMNKKQKTLDIPGLYFLNVTGLDIDKESSGGYGSAKGIASLMKYILANHPELVEKTNYDFFEIRSVNGAVHGFENSNFFAASLPGLVVSKTGFTDLAGGNLVVVVDMGFGNQVIMVVLGSTFDGRFSDIMTLYNAVKEYYLSQ